MSVSLFYGKEFTSRLNSIAEARLHNHDFGVSELAREMGISRITLHRKVKAAYQMSASRYICHMRLNRAHKILTQKEASVTQTAFQCGFHSLTYFDKCFHDYYGFSPGEVRKNNPEIWG